MLSTSFMHTSILVDRLNVFRDTSAHRVDSVVVIHLDSPQPTKTSRNNGLRLASCALRQFAVALLVCVGVVDNTTAATSVEPGKPTFIPSLVYDGEGFANLGGGLRRGTVYSGNLNLRLFIDANAAFGWPGALAYVDALSVHGGQPSNLVGDAQGVSNIAAPSVTKLYEAWLQKSAFSSQVSALAGLYDINVEFYNLQAASLFLNSSFGIGPEFSGSGVGGPSIFPNTAFGLRLAAKPTINSVIRLAVLNGVPYERPDGSHAVHRSGDGALIVVEGALTDRPVGSERPENRRFIIGRHASASSYDGKIAFGAWHYTARFDDLSAVRTDGMPLRRHGSTGVYAVGQALVYAPSSQPGPRVSAFAQAGVGDARTDRFGSYVGAGLTASGLPGLAADDEAGIAVGVARNGAHYVASQAIAGLGTSRSEKVFELTYLHTVNSHLFVQPDLQYVVDPGTNPRLRNSMSFQLRFEISY